MQDAAIIGSEAPKKILALLEAATESICLITFVATVQRPSSHLSYAALWRGMTAAAHRGKSCRALLACGSPASTQGVSNRQVSDVLTRAGWQCRASGGGRITHAKVWLIDGKAAVVGSHNLTEAAMLRNIEVSLLVTQPPIVARLVDLFEHEWARAGA